MQVVGVAIGSGVVNCRVLVIGWGFGGWRAYQWVWWGLYMHVYAGLRCASYPGFLAFGWVAWVAWIAWFFSSFGSIISWILVPGGLGLGTVVFVEWVYV